MTEWQPIETAPKDGTEIILTDGAFTHCGRWLPEVDKDYPWRFLDWTSKDEHCELNGWRCDTSGPTHWMPLPEPPHKEPNALTNTATTVRTIHRYRSRQNDSSDPIRCA